LERIGEVLSASAGSFIAGSYELLSAPHFGSFVRAASRDGHADVLAVVTDIRTTTREAGGRADLRGRTYSGRELFDHQIYHEHPDLGEVLQTEFHLLSVGVIRNSRISAGIPPLPPPVHYSVYPADAAEVSALTDQRALWPLLLQSAQGNADDLIAAAVQAAAAQRADGPAFYRRIGRELAVLLTDDYVRLTGLLRRLRPIE
jgi:hypothetical protein